MFLGKVGQIVFGVCVPLRFRGFCIFCSSERHVNREQKARRDDEVMVMSRGWYVWAPKASSQLQRR